MNTNALLDRLRVANPTPDSDQLDIDDRALLGVIDERSASMTYQAERRATKRLPTFHDKERPRKRKPLLVTAAAFIVVVAVGAAVAVVGGGSEDRSPATTPQTTAPTPTTTLAVPAPLAVVESAFAAYNSGDMATWFLWREGSRVSRAAYGDYLTAVGSRFDVEECTYRGYAVWQMGGPMAGHGFDCGVTQTDLILGAAGIELEMTYNWVIGADPESSLGGSNEDFEFLNGFMKEYRDWLDANYPDAGMTYQLWSKPSPESVPTALEYIDEFVAQSDVYPLTEPVPAGDYGGPLCLHLDALCLDGWSS